MRYAIVMMFWMMGCDGFGDRPGSMESDAGPMVDDAGDMPRVEPDGGMQMPPSVDDPPASQPVDGEPCDPDRETRTFLCRLSWCDEQAYRVCLGDGAWHCVPDGIECMPPVDDEDAGVAVIETDAGCDAGSPEVATDAGSPEMAHDAGSDGCRADTFIGCRLACGNPGYIWCNTSTGEYDGTCRAFAGFECPSSSTDAGMPLISTDAGPMTSDAGRDAGRDAGTDAGPPPPPPPARRTIDVMFTVDPTVLQSTSSMDLREETATAGATHSTTVPASCDSYGIVTEGGREFFRCRMTRDVGTVVYFVGAFRSRASVTDGWSEGQYLGTFSGWGHRSCSESGVPTAHVTWVIRDSAGRSLLNPDGFPDIVQPRSITEDTYPVCRGRVLF